MICEKCYGRGVLHAFSEGACKKCGIKVVTPHIPCYKVCNKCSTELKICQQCGEKISK